MLASLRFRPTLWPTLFTVPALIMMIALCLWQVQRLYWKDALIADRQARVATEVALPERGSDLPAAEFRRVRLEGTFQHDKEMFLGARTRNGNPGYHLVTPFVLTGGEILLVDRGWVPMERKAVQYRAEGQVAGVVTIEGVVRLPQPPAFMQPANEPHNNMWFYVDLPAMAAASGTAARTDLYVDAGPAKNPGGFPIGGQTRIEMPNDHLQYAITWGILSLALMVIYVAYHVKLQRERQP